jgi:hypothetical protein
MATFSENAYLAANSDVANAVRSGIYATGWQHYVSNGRAEGRSLSPVGYGTFNEHAYLAANPDVANAVKTVGGFYKTGYQHYVGNGLAEGRLLTPATYGTFNEHAYLAANPDVANAVRSGVYATGWQHWVNNGLAEGRSQSPVTYATFNEDAYLGANPDVAAVVKTVGGFYTTGWQHYQSNGAAEGRTFADFALPTYTLSAASSVTEGASVIYTVTASDAKLTATNVVFTLLPGNGTAADAGTNTTNTVDFVSGAFSPQTVTIAAGATTATFTVTPLGNDGTELPETFTVQAVIAGETVLLSPKTGTVVDDGIRYFTLTTGVDGGAAFTGTAGMDTYTGTGDTSTAAATNTSTFNALDNLDGGGGIDTLNVSVVDAAFTTVGLGVTVKNIEIANFQGIKAMIVDSTAWTGLTNLNVTKSVDNVTLTAAATTDVSVAQADALVDVTGGKAVTVTQTMDTKADSVRINGTAGAVTVTATDSDTAALDIIIGGVTPVKGAVVVNSSGAKIVGGVAVATLDEIYVTGGTTVSVTQKATLDMGDVATKGALTDIVTQGKVTVTGGGATTSVSVVQDDQVAAVLAKAAVTGVSKNQVVTFVDMLATETVTIDGLVFQATKALTAAEAAAAFAGLAASEVQGQGYSKNGFYTVTSSANWTSGAVSGNTVTFSEKTAGSGSGFAFADSIAAANVTAVAGAAGTTAVKAATGVLGVANGAVVIDDAATASITTITVNGYDVGDATLGAGGSLDALTTLSLANSGAAGHAFVTSAAKSLALTVNDVDHDVNLDASGASTVTTLGITTATADSGFALIAAGVTALTVSGTNAVDLATAPSTLTALQTVVVSGSAGLTIDASGAGVTSVNTTATTGTVTATIDQTLATYTGGAGVDKVTTVDIDQATKAISLGGGDDTFTLFKDTILVPTAVVTGGDGTDTVAMSIVSAAAYDASTAFSAKVTGFERLTINDQCIADTTIDLSMLGYNYVTTTGVAAAVGLTLDKMASGGTVVLTAAGPVLAGLLDGVIVKVTDAAVAGHTTDVLNVITQVGIADIVFNGLVVADVETINITATDTDKAAINTATVALSAAAVKTINVTGNANLTMTNVDNVALTLLDASTGYTGKLNAETNGTVAQTIKGGSGNDTLVAHLDAVTNLGDTLIGGAGNDTLTANSGLTQMTGGAGVDTFKIVAASLNATSFSTITDASSGDIIQFTGATKFAASKVVLDPSVSVFQDYCNAAMNATIANEVSWFQNGGNTYVVMDAGADSTTFVNSQDFIVKLTGLVDLSVASFSATNGTIELA